MMRLDKDMFPTWLQPRAQVLRWAVTTAAATATFMLAWVNLGLPTVVFSHDLHTIVLRIDAIERFNKDTRALLLDQQWWRNRARLEDLNNQTGTVNVELRRRLEQEQRRLELQIDGLRHPAAN